MEPGHGVFYFDLLQGRTGQVFDPPITFEAMENQEQAQGLKMKVR